MFRTPIVRSLIHLRKTYHTSRLLPDLRSAGFARNPNQHQHLGFNSFAVLVKFESHARELTRYLHLNPHFASSFDGLVFAENDLADIALAQDAIDLFSDLAFERTQGGIVEVIER